MGPEVDDDDVAGEIGRTELLTSERRQTELAQHTIAGRLVRRATQAKTDDGRADHEGRPKDPESQGQANTFADGVHRLRICEAERARKVDSRHGEHFLAAETPCTIVGELTTKKNGGAQPLGLNSAQ